MSPLHFLNKFNVYVTGEIIRVVQDLILDVYKRQGVYWEKIELYIYQRHRIPAGIRYVPVDHPLRRLHVE